MPFIVPKKVPEHSTVYEDVEAEKIESLWHGQEDENGSSKQQLEEFRSALQQGNMDFVIQERELENKNNTSDNNAPLSLSENLYRIVTKQCRAGNRYCIAFNKSLTALINEEYRYLCEELPKEMPSEISSEFKLSWLVNHITKLVFSQPSQKSHKLPPNMAKISTLHDYEFNEQYSEDDLESISSRSVNVETPRFHTLSDSTITYLDADIFSRTTNISRHPRFRPYTPLSVSIPLFIAGNALLICSQWSYIMFVLSIIFLNLLIAFYINEWRISIEVKDWIEKVFSHSDKHIQHRMRQLA